MERLDTWPKKIEAGENTRYEVALTFEQMLDFGFYKKTRRGDTTDIYQYTEELTALRKQSKVELRPMEVEIAKYQAINVVIFSFQDENQAAQFYLDH